MTTTDNLWSAFAGESQANRKYLAFAKIAEKEGYSQVARLFRAAADAETVHAHNHLNVLGSVKTTKENLQAAINGETYEFTEMYPGFIEEAEKEDNLAAKLSFSSANKVEKIHGQLYTKALESISSGSDLESKDIYVCQTCGNTVEGEAPDTCPICGKPREEFKKVD